MKEIVYLDFDLLFERSANEYKVRVTNSPAGQATVAFKLPFSELELENFLLRLGRPRLNVRRAVAPEMEAAKTLGGKLFEALFHEEVRGCFRSSLDEAYRHGAGLRIRLRLADTPELADLPWEYLFNPALNRFLSLSVETPIVRFLELPERIQPLTIEPPLNVLVMISSPYDFSQLDVEREWETLKKSLSGLEQRGLAVVERLECATLAALQKRLRRREYHILHFVGHGGFDRQAQDGTLILEDENNRGHAVYGEDLGMLLHDHRSLRLAILNACEGARTSRTDPFSGAAQSLVQQGIAAVIAMQFEITDEAAITFAQDFYGAVADGHPVDAALAEARKAIYAQGHYTEWGTPVLYMRSPDGKIFDIEPASRIAPRTAPPQWVQKLLSEAEFCVKQKEFEQAIKAYNELLSVDPQNPEALSGLQQAEQALAQLAEASRLMETGQFHLDKNEYSEALEKFRAVLALDPKNSEVLGFIAECERELLAEWERQQREAQHLKELLGEGKAHFENGRFKDALETFNEIMAIDSHHVEAVNLIAQVQEKITQAKKIDRLLLDAESYLKNKKFEPATETLKEVLILDPQNEKALSGLQRRDRMVAQLAEIVNLMAKGKSFLDDHEYSNALSRFKAVLNLDPNHREALACLADCKRQQKESQQINNLLSLGQKYIEKSNHKDALNAFNQVIAIDPNRSEAHHFIAKIQEQIERAKKLEKLLSNAEFYLKQKKYAQALETYKEILNVDHQNQKALAGFQRAKREMAALTGESQKLPMPTPVRPRFEILKKFWDSKKFLIIFTLVIILILPVIWRQIGSVEKSSPGLAEETSISSTPEATKPQTDQAREQAEKGEQVDGVAKPSAGIAELENDAKMARQKAVVARDKAFKNGAQVAQTYQKAVSTLADGEQKLENGNYEEAKSAFVTAERLFMSAEKEVSEFRKKETEKLKLLTAEASAAQDSATNARRNAEESHAKDDAKEAYEYASNKEREGRMYAAKGNYPDAITTFGDAKTGYKRAVYEKEAVEKAKAHYQEGDYDESLSELKNALSTTLYEGENKTARELFNTVMRAKDFREQKIAEADSAAAFGDLRRALDLLNDLPERDRLLVNSKRAEIMRLDDEPPEIPYTVNETYERNKPLTIRATVRDNVEVTQVRLHYQRKGEDKYTVVEMNPTTEEGEYEFSILPDDHQGQEIRYYISAKDSNGRPANLGSKDNPFTMKSSSETHIITRPP